MQLQPLPLAYGGERMPTHFAGMLLQPLRSSTSVDGLRAQLTAAKETHNSLFFFHGRANVSPCIRLFQSDSRL